MRHLLLNAIEAAECLRDGHILAYPTEAVFGLGCDPNNREAVFKLLSLKSRPASAGLILIGASFEQFEDWITLPPQALLEQAVRTWPGPVTWLFPKSGQVPDYVCGAHDKIAIRVSDHAPCVELCRAFGGPVVSTSANPHSAPPARSAGEVEDYFGSYLGGILAGPLGGRDKPSEIRDVMTGEVVRGV